MVPREDDPSDWMTAKEAAALLAVSRFTYAKIAETAKIRRKTLPGCKPRYSRADVLRVERESVEKPAPRPRVAKAEAVAS